MSYEALKNTSRFRTFIDKDTIADEFGEYVYNEMYNAVELLAEMHDKEIESLLEEINLLKLSQ